VGAGLGRRERNAARRARGRASRSPTHFSEEAFFTKGDQEQLAAVAASKRLPLPYFEIAKPDPTASADARSFVGIWVSEEGWFGSNRQMLLIVTSANDDTVHGYVVHGPAQPGSVIQSPAHFRAFKTKRTEGRSLTVRHLATIRHRY
jgi:hypothetical protein